MLRELPRVWLRIDLGWSGDQWDVRVESSRQSSDERAAPSVRPVLPDAPPRPETLVFSPERIGLELEALELALQRPGNDGETPTVGGLVRREGGVAPATIPLFVRAASSALDERVDRVVAELLPDNWRERVTVIAERPPVRTAPPRMSLPLKAMIVAQRPEALREHLSGETHWFRESLELVETELVRAGESVPAGSAADITIVEGPAMVAALAGHSCRLMVSIGPPGSVGDLSPTVGTYLAIGGADRAAAFLQTLTHDLPFHDALAETVGPRPGPDVLLVSSPEALHELRLTDLVTEYSYVRTEMESGVPMPVEYRPVTTRELAFDAGHHFETFEASAGEVWSREMSDGGAIAERALTFDRESGGLLPLYQRLKNAREVARLQREGPAGPRTFDVTLDPEQADKRIVDITLRRHPSISGVDADPLVVAGTTLQGGGRYDVRVRIGQRSSHSIVEGDVPPITKLLPAQDHGHDLDIVCFAGDFALENAARQPLYLPPLAPSTDTIEFRLRTPDREGPVTARIGVYHRNNLVQAFLFRAMVTSVEERRDETVGPMATLDHHATSDWENLDALGPRDVSLLVNSNGESHRLYATDGADPAEWSLPDDVQEQLAQPVRDVLELAIDLPPKKQLADLARVGHDFYLKIFDLLGADPDSRDLLRTLRRESDRVLQIVRTDVHQALPWGLVYDWSPPKADGAAEACSGTDANGDACGHTKDSTVVCARGFWGIRHLIEELVGTREKPPLEISLRNGRIGLDVSTWSENDFIKQLLTDAEQHADVHRVAASESLLARMWDASRAPVCAVIGHFENEAIETGTSEGSIESRDITEYALDNGDLANPHPLVLLLACESGAVTPNDTASHALSLVSAGVAGLVATECSVWSSQVEVFGISLLGQMKALVDADPKEHPYPLAAAIRSARWELAAGGMVAGLAFVCFGPATVRFVSAA